MEFVLVFASVLGLSFFLLLAWLLFLRPTLRDGRRILVDAGQLKKTPISRSEIIALLVFPALGYAFIFFGSEDRFLLNTAFVIPILFMLIVSIGLYFLFRIKFERVGLLALALIPSAMTIGIVLCAAQFIHFSPIIGLAAILFYPPWIMITPLALISLALIQAVIYFSIALYNSIRLIRIRSEEMKNESHLHSVFYRCYFGKYGLALQIITFPIFVSLILFLVSVFGQKPNDIILALTETGDGLFSQKHSALFGSPTDYVCTIASYGSPKLVGPLHTGCRHGYPIIFTRQLQICNAFEEWLAAYFPRVHRPLRVAYDALQIPVEKWKRVRLISNTLYLLLKPLEWSFLIFLYFFEYQPESRIQRQYLPLSK